jgi:hypothetical protein
MAQRVGVLCKSCGGAIEVQDEYIPGVGTEIVARLYQAFWLMRSRRLANPGGAGTVDRRAWQASLICADPDCRQMHEYQAHDLRLYDA